MHPSECRVTPIVTSVPATTCETCGETLSPSQLAGGHCSRCLFQITICDAEPPPDDDAAPWTQLSGCELYEEIGRGGMGVVYRARQRALDRIVAVKVLLRAQFAGAEERERFQREAQAAARLRHPGIVGIFEVGETDGVPWFSMEYISGSSLELLVRDHPLEAREAARCVKHVAEALQHAHEHGVLHRDLKPSNILLDEHNMPRITDFGIARMATAGSTNDQFAELTRTGQMLGSPGYAAPEQALVGKADVRTDVYGLGALLYHLLTGRPPFQGPTLDAILVQLRENDPLSPRRLNPSVPRDLETICLKCLHKQPADRYESAVAMADDLGRFIAGDTILARPVGPLGKTWSWTRRHPSIAAMLAGVVLLLGGMVIGSLAFARHQARMEHRNSLISEARSLRQSRLAGHHSEAIRKLSEAWSIAPSDEIRTEIVATLALPEILPPEQVVTETPNLTRSADGLRDAVFENTDIVVRDTTTQREVARLPNQPPGSLMKLDDHGERIAIAAPNSGTMQLVSLADRRVFASCEHPLPIHSLDWSGDLIATGCENRFIYIWDDQGHLGHRLSGHESPVIRVAFRPRSQDLASSADDSHVHLWHAARGVEILRYEAGHRPYAALWWSDDGKRLFGACANRSADVFTLQPSAGLEILAPLREEPHTENLGSAGFSNDGRLAAVIDEESMRVWDFPRGRLTYQEPKQVGQWFSALFSPDGTKLMTCGWAAELTERDLPSLKTSRVLLPGQGSLLRDITADGKQLVLSNNGGGQYLVVSSDGTQTVRIKHPGTLATVIAHGGSWLLTSSYLSPGAKIWSLPGGTRLQTLCPADTVMQAVLLGPERLLLKTSGHNRILRTSDWSEERILPTHLRLNCLAASLDGRLLATLDENDVRLLDTTHFNEVIRLTLPAHAGWLGECQLVFDADSRHLLIHTALGSVCRWDLHALETQLHQLGLPTRMVNVSAALQDAGK